MAASYFTGALSGQTSVKVGGRWMGLAEACQNQEMAAVVGCTVASREKVRTVGHDGFESRAGLRMLRRWRRQMKRLRVGR